MYLFRLFRFPRPFSQASAGRRHWMTWGRVTWDCWGLWGISTPATGNYSVPKWKVTLAEGVKTKLRASPMGRVFTSSSRSMMNSSISKIKTRTNMQSKKGCYRKCPAVWFIEKSHVAPLLFTSSSANTRKIFLHCLNLNEKLLLPRVLIR